MVSKSSCTCSVPIRAVRFGENIELRLFLFLQKCAIAILNLQSQASAQYCQ